jgi:hypothetical protein
VATNFKIPQNKLKFKAYRQDEPFEGNYWRIPKALFVEPYSNLSLLAKNVYSLLLDRMELSRKNGWVSESGELFVFFERDEIAKILNYNVNTIVQAFKELREYKLIMEIRQGIKKANIIYPGKIDFNCLNIEKLDSRISKNYSLESRKTIGSDTELSDPELNNNYNNEKGSFSGVETSSFFNPNNYSKLVIYTWKVFLEQYQEFRHEKHPTLKPQQLERCLNVLESFISENELDDEIDLLNIVAKYFNTNFPNANYGDGCDYHFNHFCTEGVLQNRFWEVAY